MADYKKIVANAKQKVAQAEADAFMVRMEPIDAILEGADMQDAMSLAAHVLAEVAAGGCDEHLTDLKADFLRMVDDFIAMARQNEERDAAEPEADDGDAAGRVN